MEKNENNTSIIPIGSTGLVRVGNSIEITNKIIKEHEERLLVSTFATVKIGNQEWMAKNLDVECYLNGDPIPQVQNPKDWENLETGAWCYYNNDEEFGKKYGKLYNWYAVQDKRGIAPIGFKVPSHENWRELRDFLGGYDYAGGKLKSKSSWILKGNGLDHYGFNGLSGGRRNRQGIYESMGYIVNYWTSRDGSPTNAIDIQLNYDNELLHGLPSDKKNGYYIRSIKA